VENRSPVKNAAPKKKLEEAPKLGLEFKFEGKKTEIDSWL